MSLEEFKKKIDKMSWEELTAPAKEQPRPFPPVDNEFCESHVGKTPSGGDYSTAYFFDKDGNPCRKEDRAYMNVVEYTKDGKRINEFYGAPPR